MPIHSHSSIEPTSATDTAEICSLGTSSLSGMMASLFLGLVIWCRHAPLVWIHYTILMQFLTPIAYQQAAKAVSNDLI
jgi:hypothetical protein